MYSVSEAAQLLGISASRVRKLIADNKLEARKIGRSWAIEDHALMERVANRPLAGRPACSNKNEIGPAPHNLQSLHNLYKECRHQLSQHPSAAVIEHAESSEEASFYMAVADFFLQQKQIELIKRGVF